MCNVNIATGQLLRYHVDLFLPGYIPIELARLYKSGATAAGILGTGWTLNFLMTLRQVGIEVILVDEDGAETRLAAAAGGFVNAEARVTLVRTGDALLLDRGDGKEYWFPEIADQSGVRRLAAILDSHRNSIVFYYGVDGLPVSALDSLRRRLFFEFDRAGRLTEIRVGTEAMTAREATPQVRYAYSGGQLIAVEDAAGGIRRFEYQDGLLVREIDPVGRSVLWAYDDQRRCVQTWRDGGILHRRLDFDDTAMQVRVTDAMGYSTVYKLDERRNIISRIDPMGREEKRVYDATGNLLGSSAGQLTRLKVWDRRSKCLTDAFADGAENKYYFDAQDRLVRTELEGGEAWLQQYDDKGDIVRVDAPGGERWCLEYATEGYVTRATNASGHSAYQRRADHGGERVYGDDLGESYRVHYDIFANMRAITDSLGNTTRRVVDQLGRVIEISDPDGAVRRCRYDASGRLIEKVDETGQSTRYEYGAWDQPLREIDAAGQVLSVEYDLEAQLTAVVDHRGHRLDISHDGVGRVTRLAESDGAVVTQTYLPDSDAVERRDADGTVVRIEGPRRAPRCQTYPNGTQAVYDWQHGVLLRATSSGATISRDVDTCGRLTREVQDGWAMHTTFDARNNLIGVREEDGRSVSYDYDQRRRVTAIRDSLFGDFGFSYDSRDLLIRIDYPNGFAKRLAYDRCDRMVLTALADPEGRILIERRVDYDRATRVVAESVARSDGGASYVKRYEYDRLGRLVTVLRDGGVEEWYRYDSADNIRSCHLFADSEIEGGDRLTRAGSARFEYDQRGNRVARRDTDGETFYRYDAAGRLAQVRDGDGGETTYRYDPVGRRVEKRRAGRSTTFHWLVDTVFKESSSDGESHNLFLPTTFYPIAVSRHGQRYFVFFDQVASPRELLSWDGQIAWSRDAFGFGADRVPPVETEPLCPIGFQGQYRDAETGLDYNYHRYYDAVLGRYLSPDPLGIHAGPNRYRYVPEPLTWIDPYGLFTATFIPRCDWNKDQVTAFEDKVKRYETEIRKRQEAGEEGIAISPCPRSSTSASEAYKKCNDANGKKKEGSPDGQGKPTDCKDDIDHIIDKQMGGEDNCDNYVPVNASVNRSLGSQMKREIAAAPVGEALTKVVAGTKAHCDDTTERTPACK